MIEDPEPNLGPYKTSMIEFFNENTSRLKAVILLTTNVPINRNQSVDSLCKSADWFLYDGNIGR